MRGDIVSFLKRHGGLDWSGRNVARVFHGLSSSKFSYEEWNKDPAWGCHKYALFSLFISSSFCSFFSWIASPKFLGQSSCLGYQSLHFLSIRQPFYPITSLSPFIPSLAFSPSPSSSFSFFSHFSTGATPFRN